MKCPKCKTGEMWQMGFDSSNWCCELCGHKEHRPRQRIHVPPYNSEMNKAVNRFNASKRELEQSIQEMNRAANQIEGTRRQKKASKNSGCGTIIGIIFILWLISKLLG